jgi:hypothetical protein
MLPRVLRRWPSLAKEDLRLGAVYEEFERELAAWQHKYAARPDREALKTGPVTLTRLC